MDTTIDLTGVTTDADFLDNFYCEDPYYSKSSIVIPFDIDLDYACKLDLS